MHNDIPGSFRDPHGFVFFHDNTLYRQVNRSYREHYERFTESGLYAALTAAEMLIPHAEVSDNLACSQEAYKILQPERIPFISYPYEWSFSQLRDAALLTLTLQKKALERGMSLKDCSAYNIQFRHGKPIGIDTLSFECYRENSPWVAYRQFCQHFLAPLALMAHTDIRLNQLLRTSIDGIPLDLASCLLPMQTRLNFGLLLHLHLHAKSQQYFAGKSVRMRKASVSRQALFGLIDSLETAIRKLRWRPTGTAWADYYDDTNYSVEAFEQKRQIVSAMLTRLGPQNIWDLGANTGKFSRLASHQGIFTVAFDNDPAAVEKLYLEQLHTPDPLLLPLLLDLTNPSPAIGWQHQERLSLCQRGPADAVLALALIHHLAIGNNVPFTRIAEFFHTVCSGLIVEFVPKHDSQVQRMLATREDIFTAYTQSAFEEAFQRYFEIQQTVAIPDTERVLYCMTRRSE